MNSSLIFSQLNSNSNNDNHYHYSILPLALDRKSQKQRDRYRVVLGSEILGDFLTLDEAIALANQSTHL